MKKLKRILFLVGIVSLALLTACGGSNNVNELSVENLENQKELNILFPAASFTESIEPLIHEFEEEMGVKVNLDLIGVDNYFDKVTVELSTGSDAYDIVYTFGERVSQYGGGEWLYPLDELIANKDLTDDELLAFDDFIDTTIDFATYEDELLGIPVLATTTLLYYREDLFDNAGLSGPPNTWEEFKEYAEILHDDETAGMAMRGSRESTQSMWTFPMVMYAFGGSFVKDYPNDMTPVLNSNEVIEAVDYYTDLLQNYSFRGATTSTYSDIVIAVQQGDVAMWIDGAPLVGQYEDKENSESSGKIGYGFVPEGPEGRIAPLESHMISINKNSKNTELAWKFMQWATSEEKMVELSEVGWHAASPRKSTYSDPIYLEKNNYGDGEWAEKFMGTLEEYSRSPYRPTDDDWPQVSDLTSASLSEVLAGKNDAVSEFEELNKTIEKIYKESGKIED